MAVSRRLNILHIFSGDLWAGAEVMVFNLLRRLKEYPGVHLAAISLNEGILSSRLKSMGIVTHVIPENEFGFWRILERAKEVVSGKRIDVIHAHRYKENLLALLLRKGCQPTAALVTTLHGLSEFYSPKDRLTGAVNNFCLRRYFSKVIGVSKEIERGLIGRYGYPQDAVDVIYNGIEVDNDRIIHDTFQTIHPHTSPLPSVLGRPTAAREKGAFYEAANGGVFYIGTVGRMVPVKDYDLFIEIAAEIYRQRPNAVFSILGEGPLKSELEKRAVEMGLSDVFKFMPPVEDPFPYYRQLDLYVNTSRHEGIPLSVLEAMSCGVPVVAPAVGGLPEIISSEAEGSLVQQRTPENFARACLRLMDNPELRNRIGHRGQERIKAAFTAEKMGEAYYRLYKDITG